MPQAWQLSTGVVLFSHVMPPPEGEDARHLAARGIRVLPGEVASLEITGDRLAGVRLRDGTAVARQVLAVAPRMVARAGFLAELGLAPTAHPLGVGEYIATDPTGLTGCRGCGQRAMSRTWPRRSAVPPQREPWPRQRSTWIW